MGQIKTLILKANYINELTIRSYYSVVVQLSGWGQVVYI